jgi:DNA-binding NtrC family response regulator
MIPNSVGVLLVEDDPAVLLGTQQTLQLAGFEVESFADAEAAIPSIFPDVPAIVVCDVKLPGLDGLGLLAQARAIDRDLAVILITGHGDVARAVNAMRLGAYDFVEKPFPPNRLVEMAARAAEHRGLVLQVRALRAQLADQCGIEASILGSSPAIRRVRQFVLDLAGPPANILIQGETGTGKELIARRLHQHSPRSSKPFVAVNCGSVPEQLFESEMFGHEAEHHGNATLVCRTLRIPKRTLYDKMRKLGLSTEEFHASDARERRS